MQYTPVHRKDSMRMCPDSGTKERGRHGKAKGRHGQHQPTLRFPRPRGRARHERLAAVIAVVSRETCNTYDV